VSNQSIDISIIIVNYKGWTYLKDCLKSILNIDNNKFTFETIVVDNCSDDGQLESFKTRFKAVKFIKNSNNNGFANACNLGAKNAKGLYLLFLNPDTIANKTALQKMLETAKSHSEIGALTCAQVDQNSGFHNLDKIFFKPQTMFGFFRIFYRFFNKSTLQKRFDKTKKVVYPDWISGSVVFISRNWFDKVGGWNDAFWMYYEDADLSKRLSEKGAKIAMLQQVHIKHYHGGSTRVNYEVKALTKSEVIKSRHVYISLHFRGITRLMMHIVTMLYQLTAKLIFAVIGFVFFFSKSATLHKKLFKKVYLYYFRIPARYQWLSRQSVKYKTLYKSK